jgi:hypothetical protein
MSGVPAQLSGAPLALERQISAGAAFVRTDEVRGARRRSPVPLQPWLDVARGADVGPHRRVSRLAGGCGIFGAGPRLGRVSVHLGHAQGHGSIEYMLYFLNYNSGHAGMVRNGKARAERF